MKTTTVTHEALIQSILTTVKAIQQRLNDGVEIDYPTYSNFHAHLLTADEEIGEALDSLTAD